MAFGVLRAHPGKEAVGVERLRIAAREALVNQAFEGGDLGAALLVATDEVAHIVARVGIAASLGL